jgi:hypothetical protein
MRGDLLEREVREATCVGPASLASVVTNMAALAQDIAQVSDVGLGTARWIAQAYDVVYPHGELYESNRDLWSLDMLRTYCAKVRLCGLGSGLFPSILR